MVLSADDSPVVLVTGGIRGVGRGIAEAYLAAGATVVVCGRTPPEPGTSTDSQPLFLAADVRDEDAIAPLIQAVVDQHGRLDILVNNAGGSPPAEAATVSPRFSQAIIQLNLVAPLMLSAAANAVMQSQESGGLIINIGSLNGLRASPGTAAYGAAKAGIIDMTKSLAIEYAPKVRVNCITPGAIQTPELHRLYGGDEYFDAVTATVPLGRMGRPSDVAGVCLFLSSDSASFITGSNIVVDGGGDDPPAPST
jgi:NAD(P)-dependent dehydrogenase (short-subunit alcohol dehydrogenase family)